MKNINQIEIEIKEKGLTGHDAGIEAQKVITEQSTEALSYVINSPFMADVKYQDIAELLAQVIDIFMPRPFDIHPSSIAEDLLHYIFTHTDLHNQNYRKWLADNFVDLEEMSDASESPEAQTQAEQAKAKTLAEHHLQIMANKISHILRSDKVSDDAKDAFHSIIVDASNEAGTNVGVSNPEVIKIAFPLLIESLECGYGRGVVHSLASLLDSSLVHSVEDELRQYEKRFDGRDSEFDGSPSEPEVLDV
jgi:DNA-binding transcriptional MerR regulator